MSKLHNKISKDKDNIRIYTTEEINQRSEIQTAPFYPKVYKEKSDTKWIKLDDLLKVKNKNKLFKER